LHYRFEFRPYRRPFQQPLRTSYGLWNVREGIIIKLTDADGRVGWGEIAPLKLFGSESIRDALRFCRQLPQSLSAEALLVSPSAFPACQFGLESAWEMVSYPEFAPLPPSSLDSRLLPAGNKALQTWQSFWEQGDRTFKLKIGVAALKQELQWVEQLMQDLPAGGKLRLDANGGLNWNQACQWLQLCDTITASADCADVEFLEQPLPPDQFEVMLKLSDQYKTPIALDESVATIEQLENCCQKGWQGIVVIKAAIAGSPAALRSICQKYAPDIVWSSVFETAIAQRYIKTRLVPSLTPTPRALGFGVKHWFADSLFDQPDFEQLWQSL
jgi:o-succinylbenzoate synthase